MRREANLFNRGSHAAALPSAKTRALTVCGRSERLLDIGHFPVRIKVTAHSSDSDQVPTVRQAPLWALERVCGRTVSVLQGPHSNRRSQTLGNTEIKSILQRQKPCEKPTGEEPMRWRWGRCGCRAHQGAAGIRGSPGRDFCDHLQPKVVSDVPRSIGVVHVHPCLTKPITGGPSREQTDWLVSHCCGEGQTSTAASGGSGQRGERIRISPRWRGAPGRPRAAWHFLSAPAPEGSFPRSLMRWD